MDRAMTHHYTMETLYHFTCGECENWWSYAHETRKKDLTLPRALSELSCPHCCATMAVRPKPDSFRDRPA